MIYNVWRPGMSVTCGRYFNAGWLFRFLRIQFNVNFMSKLTVTEYKVWELPIRLFHWMNVFAIITLMLLGLIMLTTMWQKMV
jgi:hypothetical protein